MNYELAQELKNAGFPQTGEGRWFIVNGERFRIAQVIAHFEGKTLELYHPTLEELIEACKGDLMLLGTHKEPTSPWEAVSFRKQGVRHFKRTGRTPTEAVAKLWLALKKGARFGNSQ